MTSHLAPPNVPTSSRRPLETRGNKKLKHRKLVNAMGITGAEGIDCDDWMLVDCDNLIVHFMTAEARQELDLETHWETVASGTALASKREKGEEGYVEDPVDWEEDFGQEAARKAGRGIVEDER